MHEVGGAGKKSRMTASSDSFHEKFVPNTSSYSDICNIRSLCLESEFENTQKKASDFKEECRGLLVKIINLTIQVFGLDIETCGIRHLFIARKFHLCN